MHEEGLHVLVLWHHVQGPRNLPLDVPRLRINIEEAWLVCEDELPPLGKQALQACVRLWGLV